MIKINPNDPRLNYPGFYNIYPIKNEISFTATTNKIFDSIDTCITIDENYGRIINPNIKNSYGDSDNLKFYKCSDKFKIVDELRVPFRKIPIFEYDKLKNITQIIKEIEDENPNHEILLRGQTSLYTINRSENEKKDLFGKSNTKEPSFQPSFVRSDFNEFFIYSLWHSQTALLLNDL